MTLESRFWSKVDKKGPKQPHMRTRCWIWKGSFSGWGYGRIAINRSSSRAAHRVAWEIQRGPIPKRLQVLHHCDVPACQRGTHFFVGSHQDNMRDRNIKGRMAHGKRSDKIRAKYLRGEKVAVSKLTSSQVVKIRAEYKPGSVTQQQLADQLGITQSSVWNALYGATWAHIPRARAALTRKKPEPR